MITKIIISNFRKFKYVELDLNPDINILVGANESGKTTILDAIDLTLTGRIYGRWAREELNPYWFNQAVVQEFFAAKQEKDEVPPPVIEIELYLESDLPDIVKLQGKNNSLREDCPGLCIRVEPDPDFAVEFEEYIQKCASPTNQSAILPTDYYRVIWHSFQSTDQLWRKPKGLGVAHINTKTLRTSSGVDYYTRQLLADSVSKEDAARLSVDLRHNRSELTGTHLKTLNEQVRASTELGVEKLGVQLDQSASANWQNSITPQIGEIPFSLCGQGQQIAAKTELAMMRTNELTQIILVEEPENHLSHTRLRQIINRLQHLAQGRQLIVTTHNSYVLNKLGLSQLKLVGDGTAQSIPTIQDLAKDTVSYFQKLSNYDTLRLILADKVALVEGPSDELILRKAIEDISGKPADGQGIDIITLNGVPFKRWLQLAKLIDKPVIAIRDNDGKAIAHWQRSFASSMNSSSKLFVGDPEKGSTLEPQLVTVNQPQLEMFKEWLGCDENLNAEEVQSWMSKHKTDSAIRLIDVKAGNLLFPKYIIDAAKELTNDQ